MAHSIFPINWEESDEYAGEFYLISAEGKRLEAATSRALINEAVHNFNERLAVIRKTLDALQEKAERERYLFTIDKTVWGAVKPQVVYKYTNPSPA